MISYGAENKEQMKKLAAELLGRLFVDAAVSLKMTEDKGKGFNVEPADLNKILGANGREASFEYLFRMVQPSMLANSESLQDFAKTFGYSVTAKGSGGQLNWTVSFKPTF